VTNYGENTLVRGLTFLAEKQAAIANNLANVDTTSFKRRAPIATTERGFRSMLDRELSTVGYQEQADMQRGTIRETGNLYDVALDGPQWLHVQDKNGKNYYTRNGQLQLSIDGSLVTRGGLAVLDAADHPIAIGTGEDVPSELRISPNGTLSNPATGQTWGPVALAVFPDAGSLTPVGKSLYVDPKNQRTTQAADGVQQGFLEGSNVDSVQELVQMITVERSFTATQKVLSGLGRLQENLVTNMLK
jgi:flagellar basal-body rod protein FlgF